MKFTNQQVKLTQTLWYQFVTRHWELPPEPSEALQLTALKLYRGAYQCNIGTREAKLINYIMRIKINEANPINDILPYIPHFEEADQIGHNHHKRSFLVRSQEAVTNCNIDTSYIMKENEYNDPPWVHWRLFVRNEVTQYIKKAAQQSWTNINNIYLNQMQQHNVDTCRLYTNDSKTEWGVAFAIYSEIFTTSKTVKIYINIHCITKEF